MGASENLLNSPAARQLRALEKRQQVLRFLRQEIWSCQDILGDVMGVQTRTAAHKNLARMEAEGLLRRHRIEVLGGSAITLWGITSHGQAMAFDPASETPVAAYFEPSRVAEITIRHELDLQRLRLKAERAGWTGWTNGDRLPELLKGGKRPDAMAISPEGLRTAIEIERTMKTSKRYEQILASYLMALKAEQLDRVVWLSPTEDFARRLRAIVLGLRSVTVQGRRFAVEPPRHHGPLSFHAYIQWPTGAEAKEPS
jgi:hypothetical protein